MKILFLDIDGVLNSHLYLYSDERPKDMEFEGNEHYMLDPLAVARLNRVIERTGAKIVISSSWRHGWTLERLREILATRGFVGEIIDITPDLFPDAPSRERGDEILAWIAEHPEVTKFVAVDDDADDVMRPFLVKTSFYRGLEDPHVEALVRHLA